MQKSIRKPVKVTLICSGVEDQVCNERQARTIVSEEEMISSIKRMAKQRMVSLSTLKTYSLSQHEPNQVGTSNYLVMMRI